MSSTTSSSISIRVPTTFNPPLQHYQLTVEYNGTRFQGFQRQSSSSSSSSLPERPKKQPRVDAVTGRKQAVPHTIQDVLEQALLQYATQQYANNNTSTFAAPPTLQDLRFRTAGRTDKGVHAEGHVVAVWLPPLSMGGNNTTPHHHHPLGSLRATLNARLPTDICIRRLQTADTKFNPRQNVKCKVYRYTLRFRRIHDNDDNSKDNNNNTNPILGEKDVDELPAGIGIHSFRRVHHDNVNNECLWNVPWPLSAAAIHHTWPALAKVLQGTHDYTPFIHKEARHQANKTNQNNKDGGGENTAFFVRTVDKISFQIQQQASSDNDNEFPGTSVVTAIWRFEACGFARGMIRLLMGFIVQLTKWQKSPNGKVSALPPIEALWQDLDSQEASYYRSRIETAAASGLCLESISYHDTPTQDEKEQQGNKEEESV